MCWLWTPGGPWREAIEADIDVSVSGMWALREVVAAARAAGRPARVQLKADTGLGRNGCQPADWPELVAAALRRRGRRAPSGSPASGRTSPAPTSPGHPSIAAQLDRVPRHGRRTPRRQGVEPEVRHIANSPGHADPARVATSTSYAPGIAMYGISPSPELGTPAELRAAAR